MSIYFSFLFFAKVQFVSFELKSIFFYTYHSNSFLKKNDFCYRSRFVIFITTYNNGITYIIANIPLNIYLMNSTITFISEVKEKSNPNPNIGNTLIEDSL